MFICFCSPFLLDTHLPILSFIFCLEFPIKYFFGNLFFFFFSFIICLLSLFPLISGPTSPNQFSNYFWSCVCICVCVFSLAFRNLPVSKAEIRIKWTYSCESSRSVKQHHRRSLEVKFIICKVLCATPLLIYSILIYFNFV